MSTINTSAKAILQQDIQETKYSTETTDSTDYDIAWAIKQDRNGSAADVATVLKSAEFTAEEVSDSLKSVFNAGAQDVSNALKQAGYTADDLAKI